MEQNLDTNLVDLWVTEGVKLRFGLLSFHFSNGNADGDNNRKRKYRKKLSSELPSPRNA